MMPHDSPRTPASIVYEQLAECLRLRNHGESATEALNGLMSLIHSIRDKEYDSEMEHIGEQLADYNFFHVITAIISLLKRKGRWLKEDEEGDSGWLVALQ